MELRSLETETCFRARRPIDEPYPFLVQARAAGVRRNDVLWLHSTCTLQRRYLPTLLTSDVDAPMYETSLDASACFEGVCYIRVAVRPHAI